MQGRANMTLDKSWRFVRHTEHATLKSNHFGSFSFVACQHPSLDSSSLVVNQTLLDIFLEEIFHTGCTEQSQTTLYIFLSPKSIHVG